MDTPDTVRITIDPAVCHGQPTIDPAVCHGQPTIGGLRYPVQTLLELLSAGQATDETPADFPDLEREDIRAVLDIHA